MSDHCSLKINNIRKKCIFGIPWVAIQLLLILNALTGCEKKSEQVSSESEYRQIILAADSLNHADARKAGMLYRQVLADSLLTGRNTQIKAMIGLSEVFVNLGNLDSASMILAGALSIARTCGDTAMIMNTLLATGNLKLDQGEVKEAGILYETGLALAQQVCDTLFQEKFLLNLGNILRAEGNFPGAIRHFTEGILLCEKHQDERNLAVALENLGMTLLHTGDYPEAEKNLQRSLEIRKRLALAREYAQGLQNLGIIYRRTGKNDSALAIYRKAYDILSSIHDSVNMVRVRYNIGIILKNRKDFDSAESEMLSVISFCRKHKIYNGIGLAYSALASVYTLTGRGKQGLQAIDSAIVWTRRTNYTEHLPAHLDSKHEILRDLGLYREAYEVLLQSRRISDSLFSAENQREIALIREKYEVSRKETENSLLKKDLEVKNSRLLAMRLGLAGSVLLLLVLILLLRIRLREIKKEKMLIDKELENSQLETSLKEQKIGQLELQSKLQEQQLVYESLVHAELTQINRSVGEKLYPFRYRLSRKKDQEDFARCLAGISRDTTREPMAEFELLFRQIHGSFYEKLLKFYPSLTRSELNICALIRLNLSTKDISRITNLSVATIETTRSHIRRKIGLDQGANLTNFMIAI